MKTQSHHHNHRHHNPPPKLKPIFSCAFFRRCTQSAHSPTAPHSPPLPVYAPDPPPPLLPPPPSPPPPPPPPPPAFHQRHNAAESSTSDSSSSTSHSFTQWRFPPTFPLIPPPALPDSGSPAPVIPPPAPPPPPRQDHIPAPNLEELFHVAELRFSTGSEAERFAALQMMEHALVPNPPTDEATADQDGRDAVVPGVVMDRVVGYMMRQSGEAKPATKVLLALCLAERNRHVAVERGAVGRVVEALADLDGGCAERALAALELMCTVAEGAAEIREHALAVPMLVGVMGKMEGRGREYALSALAVIFGGGDGEQVGGGAPAEEVGRAVMLAMQGDCSARGRRKGAQLLKTLQESGRLSLTQEGW